MSDEQAEKSCYVCNVDAKEVVVLPCEDKGEAKWVCVRCLPPLIHGR